MIYHKPSVDEPVTQGDIADECPLLVWEFSETESQFRSVTVEARVVVLTQACDLVQAMSGFQFCENRAAAHRALTKPRSVRNHCWWQGVEVPRTLVSGRPVRTGKCSVSHTIMGIKHARSREREG